jgi:hypothetical protein
MENKPENISTEWFTVIKVPILKITIGDQVFFFSPTRRINTPGELLKVLKEDAWRIIDSEKAYQANFYETARLLDYLKGREVPISACSCLNFDGIVLMRREISTILDFSKQNLNEQKTVLKWIWVMIHSKR